MQQDTANVAIVERDQESERMKSLQNNLQITKETKIHLMKHPNQAKKHQEDIQIKLYTARLNLDILQTCQREMRNQRAIQQ